MKRLWSTGTRSVQRIVVSAGHASLTRIGVLVAITLAVVPASATDNDLARPPEWQLRGELQYSTFFDIHRSVIEHDASVWPLGGRLAVVRAWSDMFVLLSVDVFLIDGVAMDAVVGVGRELRLPPFSLWANGFLGVLYTSDASLIPTFTDVRWGPALGAEVGAVAWVARRWALGLDVSFWILPMQPTVTVSPGIDIRWGLLARFAP